MSFEQYKILLATHSSPNNYSLLKITIVIRITNLMARKAVLFFSKMVSSLSKHPATLNFDSVGFFWHSSLSDSSNCKQHDSGTRTAPIG